LSGKRPPNPPPLTHQRGTLTSGEPRPLTHLIGQITERKWRTMVQLAEAGIFASSEAARKFCLKHQDSLILGRKGRVLLVDQRSLDRFFEQRAAVVPRRPKTRDE
jgi:hypothetical protein